MSIPFVKFCKPDNTFQWILEKLWTIPGIMYSSLRCISWCSVLWLSCNISIITELLCRDIIGIVGHVSRIVSWVILWFPRQIFTCAHAHNVTVNIHLILVANVTEIFRALMFLFLPCSITGIATYTIARSTLPFKYRNHALILRLAVCVNASYAKRRDSFAEALMWDQSCSRSEMPSVWKEKPVVQGCTVGWCSQSS